jgi:hypothetical protein
MIAYMTSESATGCSIVFRDRDAVLSTGVIVIIGFEVDVIGDSESFCALIENRNGIAGKEENIKIKMSTKTVVR